MGPEVAVGVGSALAQWYTSEQARNASDAERKRMAELINALQDPQFDPNSITPEQYAVVSQYVPEMAPYIEEAKPTIIQETADMARGRQAQRDALEKLSGIASSTGVDPQMQALANEASRRAQGEAQSRQASILQDANRRGTLSGGIGIASQLGASSDAMDRLASTQNQNAANAYQQRLNALLESGTLGGQMRNQEIDMQGKNAAIINAFNQRNAAGRQDYENSRVNMVNDATLKNLQAQQGQADRNVGLKNDYAKYNQGRSDDIQKSLYDARTGRLGMQSGLSAQNIGAINQRAQDQNNMIQGLGGAAGQYYQNDRADKLETNRQNREDARWKYRQTGDENYFKTGGPQG